MRSLSRLMFVAVMTVMIAACSDAPSSTELEALVKPALSRPIWDVVSLRKLDGKETKNGDKLVYKAKVEYTVKFKKGMQEMKDEFEKDRAVANKKLTQKWTGSDVIASAATHLKTVEEFKIRNEKMWDLDKEYGDFKTGDTKTLTIDSIFQKDKTDKNWTLVVDTLQLGLQPLKGTFFEKDTSKMLENVK